MVKDADSRQTTTQVVPKITESTNFARERWGCKLYPALILRCSCRVPEGLVQVVHIMATFEEKGVFAPATQSDASDTLDLEKDAGALRARRK